eukprot:TRINITY_DN24812_c0_g1_i1.p1 TRINITY_DN24812_c0_g1~~TRINITY_DN24812_c0_g1_i1.p1  ORF type:complete len:351 (-),score=68.81 TRINITY_DN24812_c0_g1_i1:77-1129(-)
MDAEDYSDHEEQVTLGDQAVVIERKRDEKLWVEKHRPKNVDEIAHQKEVVAALKSALESDNLPHLLFYGPPGTGKTSAILAIARQLYGPELLPERVLELNASDERGIAVVRTRVKQFAQLACKKAVKGHPCPPYKLIILDEADMMTRDAQAALRRIIENYSSVTRFCIICNYISRIIDPLASRCAKFRFRPLPALDMANRLTTICQLEGKSLEPQIIDRIVTVSKGDMRRAVNLLEPIATSYQNPSVEVIDDLSGMVTESRMDQLWNAILSADFDTIQTDVDLMVNESWPVYNVIADLTQRVVDMNASEEFKCLTSKALAEADRRLADGGSEAIQLLACCAAIQEALVKA